MASSTSDGGNGRDDGNGTVDGWPSITWRRKLEESMQDTRSIRGSNYVQLATVVDTTAAAAAGTTTILGEPRCRTVVMRGFLSVPSSHVLFKNDNDDGKSCLLQMCTDARSNKVQERQHSPHRNNETNTAELVWWFPSRKEQYRIRGELLFIGEQGVNLARRTTEQDDDKILAHARLELWTRLSDPGKASFYQAGCPGEDYVAEKESTTTAAAAEDAAAVDLTTPPDNFVLMILNPVHVDYLNLGTCPQYRQIDSFLPRNNSNNNGISGSWSCRRVNP